MAAVRALVDPHTRTHHLPWLEAVRPLLGDLDLMPLLALQPRRGYPPGLRCAGAVPPVVRRPGPARRGARHPAGAGAPRGATGTGRPRRRAGAFRRRRPPRRSGPHPGAGRRRSGVGVGHPRRPALAAAALLGTDIFHHDGSPNVGWSTYCPSSTEPSAGGGRRRHRQSGPADPRPRGCRTAPAAERVQLAVTRGRDRRAASAGPRLPRPRRRGALAAADLGRDGVPVPALGPHSGPARLDAGARLNDDARPAARLGGGHGLGASGGAARWWPRYLAATPPFGAVRVYRPRRPAGYRTSGWPARGAVSHVARGGAAVRRVSGVHRTGVRLVWNPNPASTEAMRSLETVRTTF